MNRGVVMKQKRWKYIQLNNSGSALISVVAVAIFLSVIATTIIYISGKNYQIKANDYQNKNTFYQAEMALDELKGALAADVSEAFKYAYREVMPEYVTKESGDKRNQDFHTIYFDCLYYMWTGATKYGTDIGKDEITTHVTVPGESVYTTVENFAADLPNFQQYFIPEDKIAEEDEKMCVALDPETPGRFIIKNVRVRCSQNGYSSYICTDIALDPPAYYMGRSNAGGEEEGAEPGDGFVPKDIEKKKLYMGDYILYMNWHKY